jgi:hypothetical protein
LIRDCRLRTGWRLALVGGALLRVRCWRVARSLAAVLMPEPLAGKQLEQQQ